MYKLLLSPFHKSTAHSLSLIFGCKYSKLIVDVSLLVYLEVLSFDTVRVSLVYYIVTRVLLENTPIY